MTLRRTLPNPAKSTSPVLRSRRRRLLTGAVVVSAMSALLTGMPAGATAGPAPAADGPGCVTPQAADGHEPPCNPALAQSPWAGSHRGSYAQASSPYPAPNPGQALTHRRTSLSGTPITLAFSEPYADGRRVAWGSVVSAPESQGVFKVDEATGQVIDVLTEPTGQLTSGSSGAYNVLDRDNHLIVAHRRTLDVYGDGGTADSDIEKLASLDLDQVLCRAEDRVVGITMQYDGRVAFASELGVIGLVPRQPELMTAGNLQTLSLNGPACADPAVKTADLEQVSNSIAADEQGGVYVVSSKAQYEFASVDGALVQTWRAAYETGGVLGGARLGTGSGSTPTLMGTAPGDDKFVVITDGQPLMHLVLMWRDEIPADWEPIAPGKDRRIACEIPVTFGDPKSTESVSEQSVLVRGNAAVVVNNAHTLDDVFALLPQQLRPFSVLADQVALNAPKGLERIDWDPVTRTCKTVWANQQVSMPNGIPTMSTESGLVYDIGFRNGSWGLTGVDFGTGKEALWKPSTILPTGNSFFAATEVGPGGAIWSGTFQGISVFRPSGTP